MGFDVECTEKHDDPSIRLAHSRIGKTITAVNNAIDTLMSSDEENRVCVVLYAGSACTLMELGHYTKISGRDYITVEDFANYAENQYSNTGACAYTVHANAQKDGAVMEKTVRNNYSKDVNGAGKHVDQCIGFSTNMQAGIYQGFQELYDNIATDVVRFPMAIVMSDGATNYALKDDVAQPMTGNEWYNVPIKDDMYALNGNYKKYRCETNFADRGGKEVILDILLTASYMKVKVQKKYESVFNRLADYGDALEFKIHTVGVDVHSMLTTTTSKWQVPRIYSTLDPKNYFKSDLNVDWEYKQDSIEAYKLWETWKTSNVTSSFTDSDNEVISFKANRLTDEGEVSNNDVIENIIYTDSFQEIESGNLDACFQDIIVNKSSFNPLGGDSEGDTEAINALSYIDPIGKYMEVKDVKKLLLFGQQYNIVKDGSPQVETVSDQKITRQYYKAVGPSVEDLEITNPSYAKETKFMLSEIKIWREISNDYDTGEGSGIDTHFDESLRILLPNNALPIHLDTIELDGEGNVKEYDTNQNTPSALPIRILYTIGVSSEIINQSYQKIDLTKLSRDYFTGKKEVVQEGGVDKTYIYFYSNYYSKEIYNEENGKTFGNASITFTPSSTNRFYVFQKNLVIYKNSSGGDEKGEGELTTSGGKVQLTNEVTDIEQIRSDPKGTYYFAIDYYIPEQQLNGAEGRVVRYAISHKGEEFFGPDGECYLTYYDKDQKIAVENKGANTVVATKKGGKRVGDLSNLSKEKSKNETNTADTYYAPAYGNVKTNDEYSIITYLGNNGRLAVELTELLITKRVNNFTYTGGESEDLLNQQFKFKLTFNKSAIVDKTILAYKYKWNGEEWVPEPGKTYVVTDNAGYILNKDGSKSEYWVGNQKENMLVNDNGTITVYKNSSKTEPNTINVYTNAEKYESAYKLTIEMKTETLNFDETEGENITATFYLKDKEAILLQDLSPDLDYTVTEDIEYLSDNQYFKFLNVNGQTSNSTVSDKTIIGNTKRVDYINKYINTVNFEFLKVASEDNNTKLSGAVFELYKLVCTDPTHTKEGYHDEIIDIKNVSICWEKVGTEKSGKALDGVEGKVEFKDLDKNEEYRLIEKNATFNRIKPTGQWKIIYTLDSSDFKISIIGNSNDAPAFINQDGILLLPNMKMFELPTLGGNVNYTYIIIAAIFIFTGCCCLLVFKKRVSKKEKSKK